MLMLRLRIVPVLGSSPLSCVQALTRKGPSPTRPLARWDQRLEREALELEGEDHDGHHRYFLARTSGSELHENLIPDLVEHLA